MSATSVDREKTVHFQDDRLTRVFPLANTTIPAGTMVQVTAAGFAVKAVATSTNRTIGVADESVTSGTTNGLDADGNALELRVRRGVLGPFGNNGTSIAEANRGARCYVVDNQTVDLSSSSGTRPVAGVVDRVTSDGVYIDFLGLATAPVADATELSDHIADGTGAHAASAIVFTPAGGVAAINVQTAIEEVDAEKIAIPSSCVAGDVLYHNGTVFVRLAKGTAGQVLTMNAGATAPEWQTP
jgi:hypothetical protein